MYSYCHSLSLHDAVPICGAAPGFEAGHVRAQDQLARIARWQVERYLDGELDDASGGGPDDDVRWYELSPRGFRLQRTPLDVSGPLRAHREASRAAWLFTSATLAVAGHFNHIAPRLEHGRRSRRGRGWRYV